MARFGHRRLNFLDPTRAFVLAVVAGGFITAGALFSILLAEGMETPGLERLLEGIGFSAGFFFVVLSEAVLFTEANVVLPATLLETREAWWRVARFWLIALVGNFVGAVVAGWLIAVSADYTPALIELLGEIVDRKMSVGAGEGLFQSWGPMILSGILANWLVGMAALFAMMGRTIFGKYIPVALAVTLFVAANFQHSPANMGFFSLFVMETGWAGWDEAIFRNLIPAGIGNLIGGTLLVALPFWYAFQLMPEHERSTET